MNTTEKLPDFHLNVSLNEFQSKDIHNMCFPIFSDTTGKYETLQLSGRSALLQILRAPLKKQKLIEFMESLR